MAAFEYDKPLSLADSTPGEVLISSYTGAVVTPFAGTSMLFNGMLGSYMAGTNSQLTNVVYGDDKNIYGEASLGFLGSGGTYAGLFAFRQARENLPRYIGSAEIDPRVPILLQNYGTQNPWPFHIRDAVQTGLSNSRSFFGDIEMGVTE